MKRSSIIKSIVLLLFLLSFFANGSNFFAEEAAYQETIRKGELQTIRVQGKEWYPQARAFISRVNQLRQLLDLPALQYNSDCEEFAMLRATELAIFASHVRPDGTVLEEIEGFDAENIEIGTSDPDIVFDHWLHSPSHYAKMTDPSFVSVGVGAFGTTVGGRPQWWAMVFSKTLGAKEAAKNQGVLDKARPLQVNPQLLQIQIYSGRELEENLPTMIGTEKQEIRVQIQDEISISAMMRYAIGEGLTWPVSIPTEDYSLEISDPSVIELSAEGKIKAKTYGESSLRIQHKSFPHIQSEVNIIVSEVENLELYARYMEAKTKTVSQYMEDSYASLLDGSTYLGESLPALNMEKYKSYKAYESIIADSRLQRFAFRLSRQVLWLKTAEHGEGLAGLYTLAELLPKGCRVEWQAIDRFETAASNIPSLPGWARSYGLAIVENEEEALLCVVYADSEPDGLFLTKEELIPEKERDLENPELVHYVIPVFKDCLSDLHRPVQEAVP